MGDVKIFPEFNAWAEEFTAIRRALHAHPELGFEEEKTSALVAEKLTAWGYEVHRHVGKTGVVGRLKLGEGRHSIGLRADMDALPIQEADTALPYASRIPGVMHACGHDGHTTTLLMVARYFAEKRNFSGTLNLFFQPAEEGLGGASAMLADGLLERFPCEAVYGWHNMPGYPARHIYVKPGALLASSDRIAITLTGRGGHAAEPDRCIDPVVAGAGIVSALQTIVSRNAPPQKAAVVTVGAFLAGSEQASNVIPNSVRILLSVRTLDRQVRETVLRRIDEVVNFQAQSFGVACEIEVTTIAPVTVNSVPEAEICRRAARNIFGEENCVFEFESVMNSEDFAYMLEKSPGCYAFISNGDKTIPPHNPGYDFNDAIMPMAASYMVEVARLQLV